MQELTHDWSVWAVLSADLFLNNSILRITKITIISWDRFVFVRSWHSLRSRR